MARKPLDLKIKKGALHKQLGVPQHEKIPLAQLQAAANSSNPKEAARGRLALTMRGWHHPHSDKKRGLHRRPKS